MLYGKSSISVLAKFKFVNLWRFPMFYGKYLILLKARSKNSNDSQFDRLLGNFSIYDFAKFKFVSFFKFPMVDGNYDIKLSDRSIISNC